MSSTLGVMLLQAGGTDSGMYLLVDGSRLYAAAVALQP